jgi:ribulose kinase
MKKTTPFARTVLVLGAAFAAAPASTQAISVQECLNDAQNRYEATLRECARMTSWWDQMACRFNAWNDYQRDRNLCYAAPLPEKPLVPPKTPRGPIT